MNGIVLGDKQYIFIETDEDIDCDQCALNVDDICKCSMICRSMHVVLSNGQKGVGVFKELKVET
ncbi:hypothetical protein [Bacteroides pyogenes]|uniref:hypothetical protein n=1 Tax=Bacteroides pyogenes TaxID=310300 RepID=UPI002FDA6435